MEVKVDVPSEDLNSTRSDMRPLLHDRDPKRVNKSLKNDNGQLQIETGAFLEGGLAEALATCHVSTHPVICRVTFEDVIAEPPSVRSFDRVWLWSHALFEVSRLWCYRLISLLLAVPVSLAAGILFAVLSCLHIWLIMPCVQLLLINMHWVQTVWASILNILISPFFTSIGQCCGRITIQLAKDKDSKTCCV